MVFSIFFLMKQYASCNINLLKCQSCGWPFSVFSSKIYLKILTGGWYILVPIGIWDLPKWTSKCRNRWQEGSLQYTLVQAIGWYITVRLVICNLPKWTNKCRDQWQEELGNTIVETLSWKNTHDQQNVQLYTNICIMERSHTKWWDHS